MTATTAIKRDVEAMKRAILPSPPITFIHRFLCRHDKPHGKYGYCKLICYEHTDTMFDGQEAVSEAAEVKEMKRLYDNLPRHCKRPHDGYSWATFEDYLNAHTCKCGNFGHREGP